MAAAAAKVGGPRAPQTVTGGPRRSIIEMLHRNSKLSDPMGEEFDYAEEFKTLDLDAVMADLKGTDDRFPRIGGRPIFGHYGGLMVRMAWPLGRHLPHHRRSRRCGAPDSSDFAPLNSWPDNANSRQGASSPVADQAEIWPQEFPGPT